MKEAEKIINGIKYWFNKDQKNRTAVTMLADKKDGGVWCHSDGTTREVGHLIYTLMTENEELGRDIYIAACMYAHEHITTDDRGIINATILINIEAAKNRREVCDEIQD